MTSTEFTAGIGEGCRISSKVLKPPGGGSSDIFGLGSYTQQKSNSENGVDSSTHSRLFGQTETPQMNKTVKDTVPETVHKLPSRTKKIYVQRNPITGEEIEICLDPENEDKNECDNKDVKEEVEQVPSKPVQTSIRVRNPPGGKSSGIF